MKLSNKSNKKIVIEPGDDIVVNVDMIRKNTLGKPVEVIILEEI